MRIIQLAAIAMLVLAPRALTAQQPAPPEASVKAAPTPAVSLAFAREQEVWNAVRASDVAAYNRLVNGTFTHIDPNGIVGWTPDDSRQLRRCTMTAFTTDEVHTQQPASGVVILSYRATVDESCGGVKQPSPLYVLSVWQRKAAGWRLIAHSETSAAER